MATGQRAFAGQSQAGIIAAILDRDPSPVSSVRSLLPASLDHVVQKCLAKDPENRWQHAADLRDELKWIAQQAPERTARSGRPPLERHRAAVSSRSRRFCSYALGLPAVRFRERAAGPVADGVHGAAPDNACVSPVESPVISPDGTRLVFVAPGEGGRLLLWSRALDSLTAQPTRMEPRSSGYPFPFWSPDGRFIGFFSDGKLKTIAATAVRLRRSRTRRRVGWQLGSGRDHHLCP